MLVSKPGLQMIDINQSATGMYPQPWALAPLRCQTLSWLDSQR
jgi:hypothetical protein